jgi:4-amino-4-deoxy-L-arabinose transferase-like glycosyltransferase
MAIADHKQSAVLGGQRLALGARVGVAWAWPLLLSVGGLVLRLVPWLRNYPLHRDEALYGYWARLIASGQDSFLLTPWVDKPPLVLYLLAASLKAAGVSEAALRLPGMVAGLLLVPFTYGLAQRIYGPAAGRLAALLVAVSPFAILFAATAFTDPWLTLWLAAAAWAAAARRPFWAGLSLGLAVASKQQGVLGIPLVLALMAVEGQGRAGWRLLRGLGRALFGFLLIFGPLTWWDSLRWSNRPSFWERSLATYAVLKLAPPAIWPERLGRWAEQWSYLFGTPLLSGLALAAVILVAARGGRQFWDGWRSRRQAGPGRPACPAESRQGVVLSLYVCGYLALHFLVTFQPWDRYLLPLLPFTCVLTARGLLLAWGWLARLRRGRALQAASAVSLALGLAWSAWLGADGRLPVGSDHGAYAGLRQVVATISSLPPDAVIYHRWLGWHYDFYLFDTPYERRWWSNPWLLADDAASTARTEPARPQWLVLPGWEDEAANGLRLALVSRGLALAECQRIYRPDGSRSFTMYQIVPARGVVR